MSYLTKYGGMWGTVPATAGDVFFVAPSASYSIGVGRAGANVSFSASDDNDGKSPERAVLTIQRAIDLAVANNGDVVVLLPGTHRPTATVNVNKAGLKILGVHGAEGKGNELNPLVVVTTMASDTVGNTGTSDDLLNVTVDNTEIGYVTLRPTVGYDAVAFETQAELNGFYMHDFKIDLYTPEVALDTRGINFSHRRARVGSGYGVFSGTGSLIRGIKLENFYIESDGAQGPGLELATCAGVVRNGLFYNSAGTWDIAVRVATGVDTVHASNLAFITSGTLGVPIEGTDADIQVGFVLDDTSFSGPFTSNAKPLDGFTVTDNEDYTVDMTIGKNVVRATATGAISMILIT